MSPTRTSKDGTYRFDRVFRGVGRLQVSSGTAKLHEFRQRDALLTRLYRKPRLDLLQALKDGRLSMVELVEADRLDQLGSTTADLVLRRPLWPTVSDVLPAMAQGEKTQRRYRYSLTKLAAAGVLPKNATVGSLKRVDWKALEARWGESAADWNHVARAVSRFLTVALGDVYHPFRREVVKLIPRRRERHRVPDVEPAMFRAIVALAPAPLRPAYWTLAMTGARLGELLEMTRADLLPGSHALTIRGGASGTGEQDERIIPITPRLWPWVDQAIPVAVTDSTLRYHWYRACEAANAPKIRLHDLRHFTGQSLADVGVSEAAVGRFLGQTTPAITRRYTDRRLRRGDAELLAEHLAPQPAPQRRKKGSAK